MGMVDRPEGLTSLLVFRERPGKLSRIEGVGGAGIPGMGRRIAPVEIVLDVPHGTDLETAPGTEDEPADLLGVTGLGLTGHGIESRGGYNPGHLG